MSSPRSTSVGESCPSLNKLPRKLLSITERTDRSSGWSINSTCLGTYKTSMLFSSHFALDSSLVKQVNSSRIKPVWCLFLAAPFLWQTISQATQLLFLMIIIHSLMTYSKMREHWLFFIEIIGYPALCITMVALVFHHYQMSFPILTYIPSFLHLLLTFLFHQVEPLTIALRFYRVES